MATTTQTDNSAGVSAVDLYNLLMFDIEPDLTTNNIEILERELELLPEEERKERLLRYADAWDTFSANYDKVAQKRTEEIDALELRVKSLQKKENSDALSNLDSEISKQ